MPTLARRAMLAALAIALLLSISDIVLAEPTPAAAEDQRILPYAEPGQLIDIGGRRINLHCTGAGGPTVILMAGIFSWSVVWYNTQPVIAQTTRVCAFDRAGYGFSDPGPRPQILSDVVDDLHAALNAGPIPWDTLWAASRRASTRNAGPRRSSAWSSSIPVRPERGLSTRISRASTK